MRIVIDLGEAEASARLVIYELVNNFLNAHRIIGDAVDLKPAALIIWLTVAVASAQRFVRQQSIPDQHRGRSALPDELAGSISRRAIARATGMPTETVRRQVEALLAGGRLVEVHPGHLQTPSGTVKTGSPEDIAALLGGTAHLLEVLCRLRVFSVSEGSTTSAQEARQQRSPPSSQLHS